VSDAEPELGAAPPPIESRVSAGALSHHVVTWDGGGSSTVVLCHGFLDLAWSWDRVARRLSARGHRVIAFDWRGHGETEWVGRGGYYHFPDYVRDLRDLLDALVRGAGRAPAHLVGHSMGGVVCAYYAGTVPDAIASLTLVEGLGPPEHGVDVAPDRMAAWLRGLAALDSKRQRPMPSYEAALARMRVQNPDLPDDIGLFLARKATRASDDGAGLVWTFDPMHQTTSPIGFRADVYASFVARVSVPAMLVSADRGLDPVDAAARSAPLRHARRVRIPGVGHMVHWHAPDALATEILSFIGAVRS